MIKRGNKGRKGLFIPAFFSQKQESRKKVVGHGRESAGTLTFSENPSPPGKNVPETSEPVLHGQAL